LKSTTVAVVQRRVGVVADDVHLRADADGAHEQVPVLHRGLEVLDAGARLVVGRVQAALVGHAGDPDPAAAVVGLEERRVADLLPDLVEV
jgi:hypothetical protein